MIRISPDIDFRITCKNCGESFIADSFHLTGMHVLGSGICSSCKAEDRLYKEMPTGSGLIYPTIINGKDGKRVDNIPFTNWFISNLSVAFANRNHDEISIRKRLNTEGPEKSLLILSAIDATYGHCVFSLFNIDYYKNLKNYHLLVLVQKELSWMVPDDIDEVWVVDIPFSKARQWSTVLEQAINLEIGKYSSAYLCKILPQAPESDFDIEEYTKTKPFPLDEWDRRLSTPVVTFIWRTDRFWKRVLPKWVDNRITRRIIPKVLTQLRNKIQFNWIVAFSKKLKRKAPNIDFAVVGMDSQQFKLPAWVKDLRHPYHDDNIVKKQCERYAESHLVIGCNGSSLVLPSCHAGGVINIVPSDGWFVSVGSFYFRKTTQADTFFRYCMLPSEVSVERITKIVVQILRDRSMIQLISGSPWNDHRASIPKEEWAKFREKIFKNTALFDEPEGLISRANN